MDITPPVYGQAPAFKRAYDYKLIIFDFNGTLVETKSGATFQKSADDWQYLPGRIEMCQRLREEGVILALATNQGGVAFGYLGEAEMLAELHVVATRLGLQHIGVCFTHPKATIAEYRREDIRRKPGPGMLQEIMQRFEIMPEDTLYIGDLPEDEQCAKNAHVDFAWAKDFFPSV